VSVRYGDLGVPLAIAHRGGAGLGPENTVAAVERSLALGLRYLETDARTTADGVVVAFHDRSLHRLTGARGEVSGLTWAQLRRLRVDGAAPVPRLADLLAAWPQVRWSIDVKDPASLPALGEVLRRTGAASRVCLAGTGDRWLTAARDLIGPQLSTALGWGSLVRLATGGSYRPPRHTPGFAHLPLAVVDRLGPARVAERVGAAGLRLVVWGVADAAAMHRLLDAGVDGLISDRADVLREVLVARGAWAAGRRGPGQRSGPAPEAAGRRASSADVSAAAGSGPSAAGRPDGVLRAARS
jgi:glycerophosphoryl diester phosphodiesterase